MVTKTSFKYTKKFGIGPFLHRKSVLLKVLLSYILIGAILISALSTLLYQKFSESSMQDIKSISEKSLEQSYRVISTLWESTYTYMYKEYTTNSALANAMFSSEFTPEVTGDIFKRISEIVNNNEIIDSIYVYNFKADYVFSSIGPYTDTKNFYDSEITEYLKTAEESKGREFTMLYRKVVLKYQPNLTPKNVISVVFLNDDESAVIFNLNLNIIQKTIGYEEKKTSSRVMIINRDGVVISHPDAALIFSNVSNSVYFHEISSRKAESGFYDEEINGSKKLILYKTWDFLGWYFIIVDDYDNLLMKVHGLQRNVIITTGIFILLSIIIAAFFIGNIYKPFYKLLKKIKEANPETNVRNLSEYDYLENAYNSMNKHIVSLKEYKSESRAAFKKELLSRIIHGKQAENSEVQKQIKELNMNLTADSFLTVILKIDNVLEKKKEFSKEDMELYIFAAGNIAEELFSSGFKVETDDSNEDSIIVQISLNGDETLQSSHVRTIISDIQAAAAKYLDFSLSAGIGTIEQGIEGIHISYQNAVSAANYTLIYGMGAIIDYADIATNVHQDYEYPLELEKNIIDAMRTGDEGRIAKSLNSFIKHICIFGYDEIRLALDQILLVSLRTARNMDAGFNFNYKDMQKEIKTFDTLKQIESWFLTLYSNITEVNRKNRENKYEEIVQYTIRYIEENFQNPDISVETISDLVNLSPNYLRTLFKDSVGKSISRYLTDLRFDKAREYLIETELAANKIGEMVGFQKSGYFYTAFKKATGVSPDEYRRLYGK